MFSKILIANRGEIAVRIIKTCKNMNIKTVAVYSQIDQGTLHTQLADECYCIGPAPANNSYMNMEALITIALLTHSEAIHPGYGFLSENESFSQLCKDNNIVYIGPSREVIDKVSNKFRIKQIANELSIPVASAVLLDDIEEIEKNVLQIGYPVIVKILNGGGGLGTYIIKNQEDLYQTKNQLTLRGDHSLYIEKYIENVKHIEVQVLVDHFGKILILGDRDCSIQINHKKIIEECPAPSVSGNLRKRLYECARKIVRTVHYSNAGTVEFLVDEKETFYFMEFNARIQVEHGITEMVTGIDIVEWQIRIAAGNSLNMKQKDIKFTGHAIECRINAMSFGNISDCPHLKDPNVRFDHMLAEGTQITPFYDSLIGKLMVCESNRENAINKMREILARFVIKGIETNINFLYKIFRNDIFGQGTHLTNFVYYQFNNKLINRARDRLKEIVDSDSFIECFTDMQTKNILHFKDYDEKIKKAKSVSGEFEAVIAGIAKIGGIKCAVFILEPLFILGSMGAIAGEKITKIFELAGRKKLPVISISSSGGARMQEGIFSLFQMAKTAGAVKKHSLKGLLYISVISNPTLGGVSASYASLGDIIIAEEDAVFGFTGRRIIEETIKKKLPDNFQTAEYAMQHGQIDMIIQKAKLRELLSEILHLHE